MERRELHKTLPQSYPPTKCLWCGIEGKHNFYHDTTQVATYRCRLCGHEHYSDVIYLKGSDPKVGGLKI